MDAYVQIIFLIWRIARFLDHNEPIYQIDAVVCFDDRNGARNAGVVTHHS